MRWFYVFLTFAVVLKFEAASADTFSLDLMIDNASENGSAPLEVAFVLGERGFERRSLEAEMLIDSPIRTDALPKGLPFLQAAVSGTQAEVALISPLLIFLDNQLPAGDVRLKRANLSLRPPNNNDFLSYQNVLRGHFKDQRIQAAAYTAEMTLWSAISNDRDRQMVLLDILEANKNSYKATPAMETILIALENSIPKIARNPDVLRKYWLYLASYSTDKIDGVPVFGQPFGDWRIKKMTRLITEHFSIVYTKIPNALAVQIGARDFSACVRLATGVVEEFLDNGDRYGNLNRVRTKITQTVRAAVDECMYRDYLSSPGAKTREIGSEFRQHVYGDTHLRSFAEIFVEIGNGYYNGFKSDTPTAKLLNKYLEALE